MNRDQIKYVAMFTMLLNHIANVFLEPGTFLFEVMVDVGYFTAITMCYFLVEGYCYTRSKEKYGKRLLLFALISEIPFCLAFTEEGTISFVSMNMLFTLFLCFLILYAMEKIPSGTRQTLCILGLVFASAYSDWAFLAPIFTYWFASCGLRDAQGKMLPAGGRNADQKSHLAGGQNLERKKLLWKVFRKAMLFFGHVKPCRKYGADHSCQGCYPVPRRHRRNSALSTLHHLSLQRKALRKTSNLF